MSLQRFHEWVKCSKCGRVMVKDRSLADCWLIHITGDRDCQHNFVPISSPLVNNKESVKKNE